MQLFYTTKILGNIAEFSAEEARHCQVLRKKSGDAVHFVDGSGNFYTGDILELTKKRMRVAVTSVESQPKGRSYYLHIGIAPTKNNDRMEWFLEKATEIGIDEITPIITSHSERKKIRPERWNKILLAAVKQSLSAHLPKLNALQPFDDFIAAAPPAFEKMIAYCGARLPHFNKNYENTGKLLVLIGPEGDFSPEEFEAARAGGFKGVRLANNRLRTETAGIVACVLPQISPISD